MPAPGPTPPQGDGGAAVRAGAGPGGRAPARRGRRHRRGSAGRSSAGRHGGAGAGPCQADTAHRQRSTRALRHATGRDVLAPLTETTGKRRPRRQPMTRRCRTTDRARRSSPARRCSTWPRCCRACPCRACRPRTTQRRPRRGACGRARRQGGSAVRRGLDADFGVGPRRCWRSAPKREARRDASGCGPGHGTRPRRGRREAAAPPSPSPPRRCRHRRAQLAGADAAASGPKADRPRSRQPRLASGTSASSTRRLGRGRLRAVPPRLEPQPGDEACTWPSVGGAARRP